MPVSVSLKFHSSRANSRSARVSRCPTSSLWEARTVARTQHSAVKCSNALCHAIEGDDSCPDRCRAHLVSGGYATVSNRLANCLFPPPCCSDSIAYVRIGAAVRDKVLLFGSSCATNCATHDPQRLTICRRFGTHKRRCPFSILLTNSKTCLSAS